MKPKEIRGQMILNLGSLKRQAAGLGMWATFRALDKAEKEAGWESDKLARREDGLPPLKSKVRR